MSNRLFGDHEDGLGTLGRDTGLDCLRSLLLSRLGDRLRSCRRLLAAVDLPVAFFLRSLLLLFLFFVLVFFLTILRLEFVV